jgi:hypothetical protein
MERSLPGWAETWEEGPFLEFVEVVRARLGGAAEVVQQGVKSGEAVHPMRPLAALCRHMARPLWARAVDAHFRLRERAAAEVASLASRPGMAELAPTLKLRLFPEKFAQTPAAEDAVAVPVAPGMVAILVTDKPGGGDIVTGKQADAWGLSTEALLDVARRNHARLTPRKEKGDGFELWVLADKNPFVATELMFLDEYFAEEPPGGLLVVAPTQQSVLYHEVHNASALAALQTLIVAAHSLYQEGEGAILPILYWRRRGKFWMMPLEVEGENVRFAPPVDFVMALKQLGVDLGA